ncbi:hypothetical protein BST97_11185 [Nonlabens spongiae]|uniref:Uncharacterized protein n=1 Tax=Nonlabens spongiae TaxID=331648 RepID=A0A1W6MLM5_9FLAO|nr:hypothetical protein BST97_11185 [Nonlabens spongiae]
MVKKLLLKVAFYLSMWQCIYLYYIALAHQFSSIWIDHALFRVFFEMFTIPTILSVPCVFIGYLVMSFIYRKELKNWRNYVGLAINVATLILLLCSPW